MSYRVFIPTAGIGSRLGKITRYINKSLVTVANRPVLSHLIDKFPKNCEFVIALGFKGEIVKEFLELIDEYQSPINKEIKDDKKAEEVWALMGDLETKLEELV